MKIQIVALFLLASIGFTACKSKSKVGFDILITNANIVDTHSGEIFHGQTIGINKNTISRIGALEEAEHWTGVETVDATDKYVVPGLWDMHVHFGGGDTLITENKNLLPLYIANGVTTVRDCAADISPDVLKWKAQIDAGELLGPSIFTAGPKLEGKNSIWPGDLEIENEQELALALDSLDKLHVDFVKITDNALEPQLFLQSIREATKRGYKTSGHIPFELTIQEASEAGQRTVEHMGYMLKAGSSKETEIIERFKKGEIDRGTAQIQLDETFDRKAAIGKYRKLGENGTAVVPTFIGSKIISYLEQDDHLSDPELNYLGPGLIKTYDWRINRANQATQMEIEARHERYQKMVSLLPMVQESGMDIIAGTDAGFLNSYIYPGFALHDELQIFVDGGLTPLQALQSSVINGPKYFGLLDAYGSVDVGKVADLLILNNNPVEDIGATKDIHTLIKKTKVYSKAQLDQLLEELAQMYQ
ncbi:amidohydrolase family protein [Flagellimonas olearia]|uniref:Amidohydrolase family protein n=1 Tax=Flagellimonas olearia TaxID=552546 RepID=A0A6I1DXW5_9FLAO|nr:amidohydrolase family protein [Allomuricauda olearia]KAB7528163.1 amidohydrolase family protein [Allomuricauda olearia]